MVIRRFLFVVLLGSAMAGTACKSTPDTTNPPGKPSAITPKKKPGPSISDQNGDVAFQAFIGRLRKAIHEHDLETLASMMTSDFGFRIEPLGEGPGVFAYWDENNVWPELELIMNEKFVPKGDYMVAPVEFLTNPDNYTGYRAGLTRVNGSWKFAYFVSG